MLSFIIYAYILILVIVLCVTYVTLKDIGFTTKLVTAIFLVFGSTLIYAKLDSIYGEPSRKSMPNEFEIVAIYVEEPEGIYYWIVQDYMTRPRYYARPYSREEHEMAMQITKKLMEGKKIKITSKGELEGMEEGEGEEGKEGKSGDGKNKGKKGVGRLQGNSLFEDKMFYVLDKEIILPLEKN